MKKTSNKSIDKMSSKVLKETLEEKANHLVSKIQNLQENDLIEIYDELYGDSYNSFTNLIELKYKLDLIKSRALTQPTFTKDFDQMNAMEMIKIQVRFF